jgi:hypothetical protein
VWTAAAAELLAVIAAGTALLEEYPLRWHRHAHAMQAR